MSALVFIVETLLTLAMLVVLLRLLLQLTRADFRNPIGQAVVKLTNPLFRHFSVLLAMCDGERALWRAVNRREK